MSYKPHWLKIMPPNTENFNEIKNIVRKHSLHTVCQEAHCPNLPECWSSGTATFMIMGDTCTRACRFCAIKTAFPAQPPDPIEPESLAKAIIKMGLKYIVLTSVDRDDLIDQGSHHFANCISEIKKQNNEIKIEALIPDFCGDMNLLKNIVDACPNVIAHNIETTKPLQSKTRDHRASYEQSMSVLEGVKNISDKICTKSSIMLGLGEKEEDVISTMADLRTVGVSIITLGQYLSPGKKHLEVREYITPEKFEFFRQKAIEMGFFSAASGPFVRSSYKAGELFAEARNNL